MPTIRRPPPRLPVRQRPLPRPRAAHRRLQTRAGPPAGSFTANPPPPLDNLSLAEWSAQAEDDIARLAAQPLRDLALADLVRFGRPPLETAALMASARFTRENLPVRLSRRIVALRNLPFIVVANPHVAHIFDNYRDSLRAILRCPPAPTSPADEARFTAVLAGIVRTHSNTIPTLARGFLECRRYAPPADVTRFLDQHLRERIGTRLMAEQHISLHLASTGGSGGGASGSGDGGSGSGGGGGGGIYIGTVDTALQPAALVESCAAFVGDICELRYGVRPQVVVDGDPAVRFAYIPVHLEYILTELLKNAFRATVESGAAEPVRVTLARDPYAPAAAAAISMRIRDRGGGISPDHLPNIWSYSFSTFSPGSSASASGVAGGSGTGSSVADGGDALGRFNRSVATAGDGGSSIAGLGYGLPLSRAYAEYFGGSLQLQSAFGWGTDVYLKLRGVSLDACPT